MTIGPRLKSAREAMKLKQEEMASRSGVPSSSYQKYELGLSQPGAEAMERFVKAGINANWLLTGDGPMLISELGGAAEKPRIETELLARLIELAEEVLDRRGIDLTPQNKARVVTILYDLCMKLDQISDLDVTTIESLIDLAA